MSAVRRSFVAVTAISLLGGATIAVAGPARAASDPNCTTQNSWTGAAGDSLWSTPGNWSTNAVPSTSDAVTIDGSASPVTLQLPSDPSGTSPTGACSLEVKGGVHFNAAPTRDPSELTTAVLTVDAAARLTLAGDSTNQDSSATLDATQSTVLGAGATLTGDEESGLAFGGSVALGGTVTVNTMIFGTARGTSIDTAGSTLKLASGTIGILGSGTSFISNARHGTVSVTGGSILVLAGNAAVGTNTTLQIGAANGSNESAVLADSSALSGLASSAHLSGRGALLWDSGTLGGHVTLDSGLSVALAGKGHREVSAFGGKSMLLNKSKKFTMSGGTVTLDANSTFENAGTVAQTAGGFAAKSGAGAITNDKGATWIAGLKPGSKAEFAGASFTNKGLLRVPAGVRIAVGKTFTQSGTLQLALGGTPGARHASVGAGQVTVGGKLYLVTVKGYKPRAGTAITLMSSGKAIKGKFAFVGSSTNVAKTFWKVKVQGKTVTATLQKR